MPLQPPQPQPPQKNKPQPKQQGKSAAPTSAAQSHSVSGVGCSDPTLLPFLDLAAAASGTGQADEGAAMSVHQAAEVCVVCVCISPFTLY